MYALNPDIRMRTNVVTCVWDDSYASDHVVRLKREQIDLSSLFTATQRKDGKYRVRECHVEIVPAAEENNGEGKEQEGEWETEEDTEEERQGGMGLIEGGEPADTAVVIDSNTDTDNTDDDDDDETVAFGWSGSEDDGGSNGNGKNESNNKKHETSNDKTESNDKTNNNNDKWTRDKYEYGPHTRLPHFSTKMTSIFADVSDRSRHSDWDVSSGHVRPIPKAIIRNQKNPNTEPRSVTSLVSVMSGSWTDLGSVFGFFVFRMIALGIGRTWPKLMSQSLCWD